MEKKTPLYDCHVAAGAKMVPFGGFLMPVQYTDIIEEHMAVRKQAGLFDVSHMGEVLITGSSALSAINHLFTNDFTNLQIGRVRYSPMCNPEGGTIDDLLIYKLGEEKYMVVVNAGNYEKDLAWMRANLPESAALTDLSQETALLALQGPKAKEILSTLSAPATLPEKYYSFTETVSVDGVSCLVSQTGYTGEHGYELYCKVEDATALWDKLLAAGKALGLLPCGLGARDTLRLEAGMPLYGHEMDETVSPLETGLGFAVKLQKESFIGKDGLLRRGEPKITRVGLKVTGRGILREHCPVFLGDEKIGETTSGTFLPYLDAAYAMALVDVSQSAPGTALTVEVRGRKVEAEIVPLPFYQRA